MMLIKKECQKAYEELCKALITTDYVECHKVYTYQKYEQELGIFYKLIKEHFSNPPLKWEEIKEGDFVFDKDFNGLGGEWLKIYVKFINGFGEKVIECGACGSGDVQTRSYKEDRFYRKEVQK